MLLGEDAVGADGAHDGHEVLGAVEALDGDDGALGDADGYERFCKRETLEEEV